MYDVRKSNTVQINCNFFAYKRHYPEVSVRYKLNCAASILKPIHIRSCGLLTFNKSIQQKKNRKKTERDNN